VRETVAEMSESLAARLEAAESLDRKDRDKAVDHARHALKSFLPMDEEAS